MNLEHNLPLKDSLPKSQGAKDGEDQVGDNCYFL